MFIVDNFHRVVLIFVIFVKTYTYFLVVIAKSDTFILCDHHFD